MNLSELRERGIEVALKDGDLVFRAPAGVITPELRDALRADKPGLMREIRTEQDGLIPLVYRRPMDGVMHEIEMFIPREKYDPFAILDILERQFTGEYRPGEAIEIARRWAQFTTERKTEIKS
jgi:hypothetical protein